MSGTENEASGIRRPVAVVTGGSRGIGRAVVEALARDGHDVALCYRSNEDAARLAAEAARAHGARTLVRRVEVTDRAQVGAFADAAADELGPVDVLVTAAGIVRDRPLVAMADEDWDAVVRTNLDGTYHACRAIAFAMMKRRTGAIVTLSSAAAAGQAGQTNYSASKAGIIGFSQALAKETAPSGLRVNAVAPGFIETDMTGALPARKARETAARIPLGRFGEAREVAELVAFLASGRASYITGQSFRIDGGLAV